MWVLITQLESKENIEWHIEMENEFFVLQEGRLADNSNNNTHNNSNNSTSSRGTPTPSRRRSQVVTFFRIILKGNEEMYKQQQQQLLQQQQQQQQQHTTRSNTKKDRRKNTHNGNEDNQVLLQLVETRVVAVSAEWERIEAHWRWIEDNILLFFAYFDRNSTTEEQALWEFLDSKTRYLAELEPEVRERALYMDFVSTGHSRRGSFRRPAKGSPSPLANVSDVSDSESADELLNTFRCTLVRKIPRWGEMRLSRKRLSFNSKKLNTRVVLPWKKVSSVGASTTWEIQELSNPDMLLADAEEGKESTKDATPALVIKASNGSEFVFIDFEDFKQAYTAIVESWQVNRGA